MSRPGRPAHPWLSLILITLLAGAIRFHALDSAPPVWGDEAQTWRRINGTWQQLVDELRVAAFQPGEYVFTWWVRQGMPYAFERQAETPDTLPKPDAPRYGQRPPIPKGSYEVVMPTRRLIDGAPLDASPKILRLIPAIFGTLMVPAMYALAAQLVARRTALLVALFTCLSAYQINYSRDAKMYEPFWCLSVMHVASLFWWLSAYRKPRAPEPPPSPLAGYPKQAELAAGVAGVLPGTHVGHIAHAFAAAPPAPAVATAARVEIVWPDRLDVLVRWACWVTSGLGMIAFHALGLGVVGVEVLFFLATAPLRVGALQRNVVALAAPLLLVVDALPRRRRAKAAEVVEKIEPDDAAAAGGELPLALAPLPEERRRVATTLHGAPALVVAPAVAYASGPGDAPRPLARLWPRLRGFTLPPIVGFALGLSAVVGLWWSYHEFPRFYQRIDSVQDAVENGSQDTGTQWVQGYNAGRTGPMLAIQNATAYLLSWEWPKPDQVAAIDARAFGWLRFASVALLSAALVGIVPWRAAVERATVPLAKRFRPRFRRRRRDAQPTLDNIRATPPPAAELPVARDPRRVGPMPLTALFVLAAWLLVPAYGYYVASGAFTPEGKRTVAVSPTVAIANLLYPDASNEAAKLLAGGVAIDVANASAKGESLDATRERIARRDWGELLVARNIDYVKPRIAWPWLGTILGVALVVAVFARRRKLLPRLGTVAGVCVALALLYGLLLVVYAVAPVQPRAIWMPRYLGWIWPAFAIALCALLMRLPLAPLRWAAVALLLGANVTQAFYRQRESEPPVERMAGDLAATTRDPLARMAVLARAPQSISGAPGCGSLLSVSGAYYASRALGRPIAADEVFNFQNRELPAMVWRAREGRPIADRLRREAATKLIVWIESTDEADLKYATGDVADRLGPTWTRVGEPERHDAYDHWTWQRLFIAERLEFQRSEADARAATRPATRPAPPQPQRPATPTRAPPPQQPARAATAVPQPPRGAAASPTRATSRPAAMERALAELRARLTSRPATPPARPAPTSRPAPASRPAPTSHLAPASRPSPTSRPASIPASRPAAMEAALAAERARAAAAEPKRPPAMERALAELRAQRAAAAAAAATPAAPATTRAATRAE